jgi:hypothetical protein
MGMREMWADLQDYIGGELADRETRPATPLQRCHQALAKIDVWHRNNDRSNDHVDAELHDALLDELALAMNDHYGPLPAVWMTS